MFSSVNKKNKCMKEGFTDGFSKQITQRDEPRPYVIKQLKIALCLTIGNLTAGYSMGWGVPVASMLRDPKQTPLSYLLSDRDLSWITTSMIIGAMVGSIISGYTANRIGRKSSLLLASGFNIIGYTIIVNAGDFTILLVGRGFAGVAAGASAVLNVVYLGEIASPNIRGTLISMTGIMHMAGSLLAHTLGPYVAFATTCYVSLSICGLYALALCYVPETPVYQVMKGELSAAQLTLHDIGRTEDIDGELKLINDFANDALLPQPRDDRDKKIQKRWTELAIEKKNRRAFLITTTLLCLKAGGGVIAVISFTANIFKSAESSVDPNIGAMVLGLTELSGLIMAQLLIEKCGRRFLLLLSFGCCSLCMGVLGTYFYLEVNHYMMVRSILWLPLFLLMLCLFNFNIGLGIVPNVLTGEVYSPPLRSICCSISMTLAWSVALGTGFFFNDIVTVLRNHGIFWFYSILNILGFFFTVFVVPETRGKSLVEIGYLLER